MNCLKALLALRILSQTEADESVIKRAFKPMSTLLEYVEAFEVLPFYEQRMRRLKKLGIRRPLEWVWELDYNAGCVQRRLVDLEREME